MKRKPGLELVQEEDDRKKIEIDVSGNDPPSTQADGENDEDDDEDDGDDSEEEKDDEQSNRKSVTDAKGKGAVVEEDMGKRKLKVEKRIDDESNDDRGLSDEDGDYSDDPLAEVDLPSRTRWLVAHSGRLYC
ncbi:hypothetical protein NE237_031378 [Protea cynaroides]|uniref:Uncharacterized protein n=1 Tax=Protea cynaroides TaxID=273540 RepID=A0A9Q0L2B7_9MAGN|nr:hypothetical protein NE237_031378 [Protea cynaroides]